MEKIIRKIVSIWTGWRYFFFKRNEIEVIANKRAAICVTCPHMKFSEIGVVDKKIPAISKHYCELCGCPSATKLRSPFEECPREPPLWGEEKI